MRHVVVHVDDPDATHILASTMGGSVQRVYEITVPPDDQLTQDIDTLRRYVNQRIRVLVRPDGLMGAEPVEPIPFRYEASEAVGRLRAAFHLDQEDEKP